MQHQRNGYRLAHAFDHIEIQFRLRGINAVLVTNRHRQRIAAGTLDKFRRLTRVGIVIARQRFFINRFIPHVAQLRLNRNTQRMEEVHRLFSQANILFEIKSGGIAHQ